MFEPSDNQVRHLEIIQGVINRMASNTFALKVLAGILAAAVLSYAGAANDVQPVLVWIGVIPVGAFWYLDCRYLRLEKLFRKLYNAVRKAPGQAVCGASRQSCDSLALRFVLVATASSGAFGWNGQPKRRHCRHKEGLSQ